MDAILLAGGFGTRLRPLTYTRPKPLLAVAGRPMLHWVLDRLPDDVDRVIVAVNWQADRLRSHFDSLDDDRSFVVVEETEPLGTAGAVKNCQAAIDSDRFFVLNADIVSHMDLAALALQHRQTGAVGTISVKEVPAADVVHYGVIDPHPDDPRRIQGFVEKPKDPAAAPSRLINAGAYLLEERVLDLIPEGRLISMEQEIFPQLLEEGFYGHTFDGHWIDVGDPERLRAASRTLDPDRWHGADADVADDAIVQDSVAGDRVRIGAGASLTGCVLGDDVIIGDGVRLTDCVIGDGEHVTDDQHGVRIWTRPVPEGYPQEQVGNAL